MSAFLKKFISISKKVFLVVAVYFTVINLFTYFNNKDRIKLSTSDSIKTTRAQIYKNIKEQELSSKPESKITLFVYRTMTCKIMGEACTDNPDDGDKNFDQSALGFAANLITTPYISPPASGIYWAYSGLQNAGFVPKTYAAEGIGVAAIKGYADIWKIFRNITYFILVIIIIAIGFMIMFRTKINPQTVISIENSLPRIVMALILINFSFAIAGFLIDMMYFLIILIIDIFTKVNIADFTPDKKLELVNRFTNGSMNQLWPYGALDNFWNVFDFGNNLFSVLPVFLKAIIRMGIGPLLGFMLSSFLVNGYVAKLPNALKNITAATFGIGGMIAEPASFILVTIFAFLFSVVLPGLLVGFIAACTLFLLIGRIFFILLTAYIQIIIYVIFAPLFIVFEALPGRKAFSFWLKNLFANLITFPLVILILLVGSLIVAIPGQGTVNPWTPPFLYGFNTKSFSVIVGIGIIMIIPDLIKAAKEMLGVKGSPFNIGLGTFFGAGGVVGGGAVGILGQFSTMSLGLSAMGISKRTGFLGLFGDLKTSAGAGSVVETVEKALDSKPGGTPTPPGTK